jgi:hypothetical protein
MIGLKFVNRAKVAYFAEELVVSALADRCRQFLRPACKGGGV